MKTFSEALEILKKGGVVKRSIIKNDDCICNYKNRLYWLAYHTGIRYPYRPTNADLMADDWEDVTPKKEESFWVIPPLE